MEILLKIISVNGPLSNFCLNVKLFFLTGLCNYPLAIVQVY